MFSFHYIIRSKFHSVNRELPAICRRGQCAYGTETIKKPPAIFSRGAFERSFGNVYARGVILNDVDAIAAGGQGDDQFIDFLSGQRGQCL